MLNPNYRAAPWVLRQERDDAYSTGCLPIPMPQWPSSAPAYNHTGSCRKFATLPALCVALRATLASRCDDPPGPRCLYRRAACWHDSQKTTTLRLCERVCVSLKAAVEREREKERCALHTGPKNRGCLRKNEAKDPISKKILFARLGNHSFCL
jgi:hypothetical protein